MTNIFAIVDEYAPPEGIHTTTTTTTAATATATPTAIESIPLIGLIGLALSRSVPTPLDESHDPLKILPSSRLPFLGTKRRKFGVLGSNHVVFYLAFLAAIKGSNSYSL